MLGWLAVELYVMFAVAVILFFFFVSYLLSLGFPNYSMQSLHVTAFSYIPLLLYCRFVMWLKLVESVLYHLKIKFQCFVGLWP